jgi:hypothetical protein
LDPALNAGDVQAVGRQQDDFRPTDVLLEAVAVATTARRQARSAAVTLTMIPLRMAQTRTTRASEGSQS